MSYLASSNPDMIEEWSKLGIEHRIHFRAGDGIMETWYRDTKFIKAMAIGFEHSTGQPVPIGIGILLKQPYNVLLDERNDVMMINVAVYVKFNYRRLGVGSRLVAQLGDYTKKPMIGDRWNGQSTAFYESVGTEPPVVIFNKS